VIKNGVREIMMNVSGVHGGTFKAKHLLLAVVVGLVLSLSLMLPSVISAMAVSPQYFEYELASSSAYYTFLGDFNDEDEPVGTLTAYDSGGVLHIGVYIWAKPYLGFGETDSDKDGDVEWDDIRSDGINITVFDGMYQWWVDPEDVPNRDPEYNVPSWTDGVSSEPIVYLLNVPIPDGYGDGDTISIGIIDVHVSPKEFVDPTPPPPIPEVPVGTIVLGLTAFAALFLFKRQGRSRKLITPSASITNTQAQLDRSLYRTKISSDGRGS